MACSPEQDQFIWPLEYLNITKISSNDEGEKINEDNPPVRSDWELPDYVDPEEEDEAEAEGVEKTIRPPAEMVQVIKKIRYFISEKQANDFINSCW